MFYVHLAEHYVHNYADASTTNFEPINLYATPQLLVNSSCFNTLSYECSGDILVLAPLERRIYLTINRYDKKHPPHPSLCLRLGDQQDAHYFMPLIQECVSMATLDYAHGPTDLTNPEPLAEYMFYALQAITRTINTVKSD